MNFLSYLLLFICLGFFIFHSPIVQSKLKTTNYNIIAIREKYSFSKNKEYLKRKLLLQEDYVKLQKKDSDQMQFLSNCISFGKEFYGPRYKAACKLQLMYLGSAAKLKKLQKILEKEDNFYQKFAGKNINLVFGGDIMLSRGVGAKNKEEGYDRILKKFHPLKDINTNTVVFFNLESPFTQKVDNDLDHQSFMFRSNPKNIEVLTTLRNKQPMVLSLANNHIHNAAGEGIDSTIDILSKAGISSVGVAKGKKAEPYVLNYNEVKLCFGAYSYDGKVYYMRDINGKVNKYFVNKVKKEDIIEDIKIMITKNCDLKIISLHWGREYKKEATKHQKELAHAIIDAGADVIIGAHSHIMGEVEDYKGKKIYYSLGNYIFDQDWGKTVQGGAFDRVYDPKLDKYSVATYIGNTVFHSYFITNNKKTTLLKTEIKKHRITEGAIEKY